MKYKVVRRFRDKYTGVIYNPGDTFTCNEPDRITGLLKRGLIEESIEPNKVVKSRAGKSKKVTKDK